MSDTSNPGPAPTNNAPPSNPAPTNNAPPVNPSVAREVPIDREPVARPNPLGPQTPDKPVAEARREAVQRAFDRANKTAPPAEKTPPRAPPKAAEAKPGHNQPPDETPPERFDLRKRPTDDQPRDRGRFAPRAPREEGQPAAAAVPGRAPGVPGQAQKPGWQSLPETEPFRQPPARMSEQAKAEWHTTPASVRADLNRMQDEFVKAYRVYKNDFDEMSKIRHFHKMATDHGTTLAQALTNYVGMEQKLRADPVAGLDVIVNNLNLRTPDGQKLGLRDIAYHVLSQSPEQLRQLQMGNQQSAASQQIMALNARIEGLQQTLQQMHTQQQFVQTRSAIDVFADSHPRFDELGTLIEQELKHGYDIETAYRRAELLRPPQAAQTRTTPAQTREPDRSIHGANDTGSSSGTPRPRTPSRTPRDAVTNAIRRLNGSL